MILLHTLLSPCANLQSIFSSMSCLVLSFKRLKHIENMFVLKRCYEDCHTSNGRCISCNEDYT
jgi:hypothetical protein